MTPEERARETKIIVQYRAGGGMVYELQSSKTVISIKMSQRDGPPSAGADLAKSWCAQAHCIKEQPSEPVDGWGPTAAEALEEVAQAWRLRGNALATFDWAAVTTALKTVRAI